MKRRQTGERDDPGARVDVIVGEPQLGPQQRQNVGRNPVVDLQAHCQAAPAGPPVSRVTRMV